LQKSAAQAATVCHPSSTALDTSKSSVISFYPGTDNRSETEHFLAAPGTGCLLIASRSGAKGQRHLVPQRCVICTTAPDWHPPHYQNHHCPG